VSWCLLRLLLGLERNPRRPKRNLIIRQAGRHPYTRLTLRQLGLAADPELPLE
jgi:hypothetical protein